MSTTFYYTVLYLTNKINLFKLKTVVSLKNIKLKMHVFLI